MNSLGPGQSYLPSRAVEEPLEATFELGENLKEISARSVKPILLGILGLLVFAALLAPSIYLMLSLAINGALGRIEFSMELLLQLFLEWVEQLERLWPW